MPYFDFLALEASLPQVYTSTKSILVDTCQVGESTPFSNPLTNPPLPMKKRVIGGHPHTRVCVLSLLFVVAVTHREN